MPSFPPHPPHRIAIHSKQVAYSYETLYTTSQQIAHYLLNEQQCSDLQEQRIAFMVTPSFEYVAIQWGIWQAGGIVVPLSLHHPLPSVRYFVEDTATKFIIADDEYLERLQPLASEGNITLISTTDLWEKCQAISELASTSQLPIIATTRRAMIVYTSGTTNLPKGVVTTHANIKSQITTLIDAWAWDASDHILNILPLHHVHGIINVVSCALWAGATVEFLPKFEAAAVMEVFKRGAVNVFMAVPTIYYRLINYWEGLEQAEQQLIYEKLKAFRLMVSGSAALPISTLEKWRTISGHTLLERYGMTEIGMAVSNAYQGERRPGHIGLPLPNVDLRLLDEEDQLVGQGEQGEIQVKGPNVFLEYWNKPEATSAAFTPDAWFRTGDIAIFANNSYRIIGRSSVDIIKSGGYKISALEIEEVLRQYPGIKDCAVVGIADDEWGEVVAASLILEQAISYADLKQWLKAQMPTYRIPRRFIEQDDLPRNALGKVTKKELKKCFLTK